jgi:omega-amidase
MKISIVSLDQIWEDKSANRKQCELIIELSSSHLADLVVFPEMTLTGFSMNMDMISENITHSETISFFKQLAYKNAIAIVFGVVIKGEVKSSNRLIFISETGEIIINYAKIHPFTFSNEDQYFSKGNEIGQCKYKGVQFGFGICYDLRFPEIYQRLSELSEVIITIANWPKKRIEHWETLLKARAIENQSIIIGVNRTGCDGNGIEYIKSSIIFNENGVLLDPIYSLNNVDIYDLEPNKVGTVRKEFPVKNDRRKDLYKNFYNDKK